MLLHDGDEIVPTAKLNEITRCQRCKCVPSESPVYQCPDGHIFCTHCYRNYGKTRFFYKYFFNNNIGHELCLSQMQTKEWID